MIQVVLSTVRKTHGTHGNGNTPLMPFLTMKKDGQRVVFDVLIKSVKYAGGVIKDVNKYMTYSIFSHSIAKAEECAGKQQLFVGYLFIYRGISYSLRFAP